MVEIDGYMLDKMDDTNFVVFVDGGLDKKEAQIRKKLTYHGTLMGSLKNIKIRVLNDSLTKRTNNVETLIRNLDKSGKRFDSWLSKLDIVKELDAK